VSAWITVLRSNPSSTSLWTLASVCDNSCCQRKTHHLQERKGIICTRWKKSREKKEFQYKNAPKRDQTRETGQASDDQASSKPSSQISAQNHQTSSLQTAFSEVTSALLALLFVSWVDESVGA